MHEDEDEADRPLVRPASRKEPAEERRDPATDDEDLLPLIPPRRHSAAPVRKRKGRPVWQDPTAIYWNKRCQGTRASDHRIPRFLGKKAEGEALRNIISKLPEERNLRDFYLKHYHMSTAFDPCEWTMVVFWKEDSGRQLRLITPENEGGDETSSPSPPRFTFFDDPDFPLSPPDTPPLPPSSWTARFNLTTTRIAPSSSTCC